MFPELCTVLLLIAAAAAAVCFGLFFLRRTPRGPVAAVPLSIAAGLLLAWLVQTGAERMVFGPAEMFRFSAEGAFLPGKAAVLLVCLLVCLCLGLTVPGRRFRARLAALTRKNGFLWLASLLSAALFFLWSFRITVPAFMTNDDTSLLSTIASVPVYGLRAARGAFSTLLFCRLLSLLYGIDPEGWWYAGYQFAVVFAACVITGRCILLKTRRRGWAPLWGILLQWLVFCGIFLSPLAEPSFTVTPAVAGSAAVALILCRDEIPSRAGRIASDAGAVLLILLCWLQRKATGRALFCFAALACVYQAVKLLRLDPADRRRRIAGLTAAVLAGLILFTACRGVNTSLTAATNTEASTSSGAYWDAEYYRSIVMDYLGPQLTTEQLEAVGIPPELGNLMIKRWYFMDERVNTDTFRRLTELYYHPDSETADDDAGLLARLKASYADSTYYIRSIRYLTAAGIVLALLSVVLLLRYGRRWWAEFLCGLCAPGGAAILCLYLMLDGRFLYRVFEVAAIPALVTQILMCLTVPEEAPAPRRWTAAASGVCIAALCVLCGLIVTRVPYTTRFADRESVFSAQWKTEEYAFSHPDTYFVTNFFARNLDPLHGGTYPDNMHLWGGTGVTAKADEDRLFADDFFRDDVRFMCELPGSVMMLLQYLTLDNGPVAALDEAHLTDNITVFDLDQIRPEDGADGWYDWNGLRFYFRDGQALAGSQVIDGTEYDFGNPGAASLMFSVDTDNGPYFLTRAYVLSDGEAAAP